MTQELINRLVSLKSLLDLGDMELVSIASLRLEGERAQPEVAEILDALHAHRYAEAANGIQTLLALRGQLLRRPIDPEIALLEAELERAKADLADFETEHAELEHLISRSQAAHNEALGILISRMDQRLELVNRLTEEIQTRRIGLSNKKTLEVPLGSGVVMLMKWCPAGSFLMGSSLDEEDRKYDETQVRVTLSQGFWMGQMQVTQAQWQAVMGNNPSQFKGKNRPVESITWQEAQEFVSKLNTSFAIPDGMQMTLPTEAQWEYAARAGATGPDLGSTMDEVAWYAGNSENKTHPVGMKNPNAWGLHDMLGNVMEWCADWYEMELEGGIDPQGASSGTGRVIRGGYYNNLAFYCRVAFRFSLTPAIKIKHIGFRVARSSVP
ncbi:MAG: SUMF1/EgtB/PvdO family nonheme iron enzyme [Akkermansiaceae bacterium]